VRDGEVSMGRAATDGVGYWRGVHRVSIRSESGCMGELGQCCGGSIGCQRGLWDGES
jgi:hypothetical protein